MDCTSQLLYSRLGWIGSRSYHVTKSRRIFHEPKKGVHCERHRRVDGVGEVFQREKSQLGGGREILLGVSVRYVRNEH